MKPFLVAALVFVALTFAGWVVSALLDAARSRGPTVVARFARSIAAAVAPRAQRDRVRDEIDEAFDRLPPRRQVAEAAWLVLSLWRLSSSTKALNEEVRAIIAADLRSTFFELEAAGTSSVSGAAELKCAVSSVAQCRHSMRTISYREDDWWRSSEGGRYLDEQSSLIARGGRVERIFVIPGRGSQVVLNDVSDILDDHARRGILVYVVFEQELPGGVFDWVEDFVVYDDHLLRTTTSVPASGLEGRTADLQASPVLVRRALHWFGELKLLAERWPTGNHQTE
jgi:hypothetical protein